MIKNIAQTLLQESAVLKNALANNTQFTECVVKAGELIKSAIQKGGTIYVCGNGGSTCDAMHFTEELVARFKRERKGIKAMHFSDAGVLTCWGNDYDYKSAFERYADTFCGPDDVLVGISSSGNSENVLHALKRAKEKGCASIGLVGKDGGRILKEAECSVNVLVDGCNDTERIQEVHICVIHIWCEMVDTARSPD